MSLSLATKGRVMNDAVSFATLGRIWRGVTPIVTITKREVVRLISYITRTLNLDSPI